MRVIGITGGVGAGKSAVLKYLEETYQAKIILADEVGHKVKEPGEVCYAPLIELLGEDVLEHNTTDVMPKIDKAKMAEKIFADKALLQKVNELIHPAVREEILKTIEMWRQQKVSYVFVESALFLEAGYQDMVEQLWYVRTSPEVRRARLKETRGYSDEKIDAIMKAQLPEETYEMHCKVIIDNSGDKEALYQKIDKALQTVTQ